MVKVTDQAHFEHFQGRWFLMRCLRPPTDLPARGDLTHKLCMEAQDLDWLVRSNLMNGFVVQLQNSNAAVDTGKKRLQIEGSMRLGEGALGGTPQKKLRSRYETSDRQGQQTFLSLRV
jgi:hypothetical protein